MSSLVRELTESAGDIEFGAARNVELEGLAGAREVYDVRWQAAQARIAPGWHNRTIVSCER